MNATAILEGFAISPNQRRLWNGGRGAPRMARCSVELTGELDPMRLEEALQRAVAEHEILRTTFPVESGSFEPSQWIEDAGSVSLELSETWPPAAGPVDLERLPLLRAVLYAEGPGRWRLEVLLPALCADRATLGLLVAELVQRYAGGPAGETAEEPLQFADLATWQNDLLESEEAEVARALYRAETWLARHLELPFARPAAAPEKALPAGGPYRLRCVAGPGGGELDALARELGTQPREILLAAWTALLARLGGGRRIVVGVEHDGRKYNELAEALGPFAKYLPVDVEVTEEPFAVLVERVAAQWEAISEWEEFFDLDQLASLAENAGEPAAPGRAAFPVCFSYDELPPALAGGGLRWRILERDAGDEPCELALHVERRGEGLRLELRADRERYVPETATLAARYRALLAGALERPATPVAELPLLSPAARFQVLVEWNDSRLEAAVGGVLTRLLSARAERFPDRPAVVFDELVLTYGELQARSRRLAHHLVALGVTRRDRVAICLERSLEMVVAMVAVLEAGAAYLPLAPDEPPERLGSILEEAGNPWLMTAGRPADRVRRHAERLVDLDRDRSQIDGRPPAPLPGRGPEPRDLAYVIYTSGSTGRPKGVMIPHGAICNRLLWMQHHYPLESGDRVLLKTPYTFDASVWELFCPLLAGAAVVVAQPGGHQDPEYLARTVATRGVTVLQLVPSALRLVLESRQLDACASLRRLFCGGEALPAALVERFQARLPIEVVNLYGPTEVSIDASSWRLRPGSETGSGAAPASPTVPIGRPLANLRLHLLDARGRPCPPGVAGELCVGGPSLARGYSNRPAQTAGRFVPDPCASAPGERLYRTGDVARRLAGGELEFAGRRDHQVKVRGFRIELGEIENVLEELPQVLEAAVVTFENGPGDVRLKACVAMPADAFRPDELVARLGRRLPEHMVPASFVRLERLPRLSNGKVDRGGLARLEPEKRETSEAAGPRSLVRDLVADMWCEVLDVDEIDAHANVFERGAHSLLVIQVVMRIQKTFRVSLSLRAIFEAPTVARLAARIEGEIQSGASAAEEIGRAPRDRPLPLSFAQQRLWFLDQLDPGSAAYCTPEAFRLVGPLSHRLLDEAWLALIARHETLRTLFPAVDGEPVQEIHPPWRIAIPRVDLEALAAPDREAEIRRLAAPGRQPAFDLARGPLLRVSVLRLADGEHAVLVTLHHIVSDAWSGGVVGRELAALYEAGLTGSEADLPPLTVQYADYAVWQRHRLRGEVLEAHLGYWKRQLQGVPFVLDLPTDRPRPAALSSRGGVRQRFIPAERTARLKALARGLSSSLYMVTMAAYQVLLHHLTGSRDFLVGTTIANRDLPETERLIGFFVNLLALRCRFEGVSTFSDLLDQVREVALEAYSHQALPIDRLIQELGVQRDPSRSTLCQAVLTFENVRGRAVEAPSAGVTLSQIPVHEDTAVFDLALILEEKDGGLEASFRYMSDLFRPATIDAFLEGLEHVFEAVAGRPEIALAELTAGLEELDRRRNTTRESDLAEASLYKLQTRMRSRRRQAEPAI